MQTTSGSVAIKLVNAGGTLPAPASFVGLGSDLFFVNSDAVNGVQMWVSDGTSAGTQLLKDIYPGTSGSYPFLSSNPVNGKLLMSANDGVTGTELWATDGTSAG